MNSSQTWNSNTNYYEYPLLPNQLSQQYTVWDDGTARRTQWDLGGEAWSQVVTNYTTSGAIDNVRTFMDNGTRYFYDADQNNNEPWQWVLEAFDLQGRFDAQTTVWNDGSWRFHDVDQAS